MGSDKANPKHLGETLGARPSGPKDRKRCHGSRCQDPRRQSQKRGRRQSLDFEDPRAAGGKRTGRQITGTEPWPFSTGNQRGQCRPCSGKSGETMPMSIDLPTLITRRWWWKAKGELRKRRNKLILAREKSGSKLKIPVPNHFSIATPQCQLFPDSVALKWRPHFP